MIVEKKFMDSLTQAYAHLDYSSKISSAQAMEKGVTLPEVAGLGSRWQTC